MIWYAIVNVFYWIELLAFMNVCLISMQYHRSVGAFEARGCWCSEEGGGDWCCDGWSGDRLSAVPTALRCMLINVFHSGVTQPGQNAYWLMSKCVMKTFTVLCIHVALHNCMIKFSMPIAITWALPLLKLLCCLPLYVISLLACPCVYMNLCTDS